MRFLIDAQLPPALTRLFSDAGHLAEHVFALGLVRATDAELWDYARLHDAIIVTKDEDFSRRIGHQSPHPAVIWLRIGNCSNAAPIARMAPSLGTLVELIEASEKLIELR